MKKKLGDVLSVIYQNYVTGYEARGIGLDFDLPDPTFEVEWSEELEALINAIMEDAAGRLRKGDRMVLGADRREDELVLFLKSTGAALPRGECEARSSDLVRYRSRYGYGTEVEVTLS